MASGEQKYEQAFDKLVRKMGLNVLRLDKLFDESETDTVDIYEIRVKKSGADGDQRMAIIKGTYNGRKLVLFNTAESVSEAIAGALAKVGQDGGGAWKDDKPYGG